MSAFGVSVSVMPSWIVNQTHTSHVHHGESGGGIMARNIWTVLAWIAGIGIVCFVGLALLIGPTLYREGRAIFEPLQNLSSIEERMAELNTSFPFAVPSQVAIDEDRLLTFLSIRDEWKDHYEVWDLTVKDVEDQHGDSWSGAKKIIALTSEVVDFQVDALREHGMSPEEFLWLEKVVYRQWLAEVDQQQSGIDPAVVTQRLQEAAEADLALVQSLRRQHGDSAALSRLERHFRQRVEGSEDPAAPDVPGLTPTLQSMLWSHRDRIIELDFSRYPDIHSGILKAGTRSEGSAFKINIGRVD